MGKSGIRLDKISEDDYIVKSEPKELELIRFVLDRFLGYTPSDRMLQMALNDFNKENV